MFTTQSLIRLHINCISRLAAPPTMPHTYHNNLMRHLIRRCHTRNRNRNLARPDNHTYLITSLPNQSKWQHDWRHYNTSLGQNNCTPALNEENKHNKKQEEIEGVRTLGGKLVKLGKAPRSSSEFPDSSMCGKAPMCAREPVG